MVREYVILFEDTPAMIAGRIDFAWRCYTDSLLPPFFEGLLNFAHSHEYSWHTPGHSGGAAFRASPIGNAFFDFYGEELFRTDLSVSVGELGSLLDHSGVVGDAERNAARVFGADQTYFVLNGTSTSNQIVAHSCVTAGDFILVDRNCHKSLNYATTITDAIPVYLVPSRNGYGIIGPIPRTQLAHAHVETLVRDNPLGAQARQPEPVYAVVTNSTYDGLCYRADQVIDELGVSTPRIHFDEAWFAYARFHPLYAHRFAMTERDATPADPTIFATQSTHKLLAAFSQGSMIHVRSSNRAPVSPSRFNEAYMMHGSTSPFYPMIACLDVATAMMDDDRGRVLMDAAIREAIHFRQRLVSLAGEFAPAPLERDRWFFGVWQPRTVRDPDTGETRDFVDASTDLLANVPSCWVLAANEPWHGFGDLGDDYCMLDPIKVTLTTPGVDAAGVLAEVGIAAAIVTRFLDGERIEVEKTGDYTILFLFALGTTRAKWGTLVEALLSFKRAYDTDVLVSEAMPELDAEFPGRYGSMTLRALCDEMHRQITESGVTGLLDEAFSEVPTPVTSPGESYRRLVRGESEMVPVSRMAQRAVSVMVVPYPPGIPVLMPGEDAGAQTGPVLRFLMALQSFDQKFPGFSHDIHGVERDEQGIFSIECLTSPPKG
jgi:arginine decarboxylase